MVNVRNGVELMEWLNKNQPVLPQLIFLDLNMPLKNGIQCLKEIGSSERLKNISVAIYSTSKSDKNMEDAFFNGANVYISKPTDFNSLKAALEKVLATVYQCQNDSFKFENFLLRI